MFRRSRFSVRPNVGATGRVGGASTTAAASQESPPTTTEISVTPKEAVDNSTVTKDKSNVTPSEKVPASGDGNDRTGEGSSTAVQRRKRFSVKPKVAPGRPAPLPRTPKSPVKAPSETPVEVSLPSLEKSLPITSSPRNSAASVQGLLSPRRRRPSEGSKQIRFQTKPAVVSSESSTAPPANGSPVKSHQSANKGLLADLPPGSQVKDAPLVRGPDKIPLSLPDREAAEISEKARHLVRSKNMLSLTPSAYSLSRLLNTPSDLQRLVKAKKLRELLKEERRKETTLKRAKARAKEYSLDPSKMTMRDLIHYLPTSNPMLTSFDDPSQENETVLPATPEPQKPPEEVKEPEVAPEPLSEDDAEEADEEEDDDLMVPQVKVAADGSLIIDEESLTVEVQRAKGPNLAADRDPIFERGSTTTYSSFRKGSYTRPWSSEETDMFFLAVSMVGTDFTMICQLFPHRARSEIKNKFKKEERQNSWRVDKAFKERRKLDIEYFTKLLEKIMDYQKNKKKLKSLEKANAPKKRRKRAKASGKKEDEDDEEEEEEEVLDLEEEGEKENEDVCNEGGASGSEIKKKKKRKKQAGGGTEEPTGKKSIAAEMSLEQSEVDVSQDAEAALPGDHTTSDIFEKSTEDNIIKESLIKPAQLSRGRAPKPLLPLGRKWAKKLPKTSECEDVASKQVEENSGDEQEIKAASPSGEAKVSEAASDGTSSEDEETTIKPPKPTRYGRVPKPTKPLTYSPKEDTHSSASETPLASHVGSPPSEATAKGPAKRRRPTKPQPSRASKKPKLITLTASQSDFSDEEGDSRSREEELALEQLVCCSSDACSDSVFVPASLHTPQPVISEVDETMAELDILASMPDVLGISHEDSSGAQAQQETGLAEPFEHQLDLLVDVIDYLDTEHTEEVSQDQSYNEAAETLLTIGNVGHASQIEEGQTAEQDRSPSDDQKESPAHSAAEEESSLQLLTEFGHELTEMSTTASSLEVETVTADNTDMVTLKTSDQICEQQTVVFETVPTPKLHSCLESPSEGSPQTNMRRMSKVKPKPNLGRNSRASQLKLNSEGSVVEIVSLPTDEDTGPNTINTFNDESDSPLMEMEQASLRDRNKVLEISNKDAILFLDTERLKFSHNNEEAATSSQWEQQKVQSKPSSPQKSGREKYESPDRPVDKDTSTRAASGEKKVTFKFPGESQISEVEPFDSGCVNVTQKDLAIMESPVEPQVELKVNVDLPLLIVEGDCAHPSRFSKTVEVLQLSQEQGESFLSTDLVAVAVPEPPVQQRSDEPSAPIHVQADQESAPAFCTPPVIQKEVETALIPQVKKSRLQKPIPNLPQISRSLRSKPGTIKICEAQDMTAKQSFGDTRSTADSTNEITPACVPTESSCINVGTIDCAGAGVGSNSSSAQFLEGQETVTTQNTCVEQLLIHKNEGEAKVASEMKKSEFQKPQPIVPQKEEKLRSKPETAKEGESTGITSDFTEELTSSLCPESCFKNEENVLVTEPPVRQCSENDFNPDQDQTVQHNVLTDSPVYQKEVAFPSMSRLRKSRLQKPKPNLPQMSRPSQSKKATTTESKEKDLTTKESLEDRGPSFDCANLNLSSCAQTESSCLILEKTDSAVTVPQVKQCLNVEGGSHSASPIPCFEDLEASQKESEVASTSQQRKSRLQKLKPNIPQSSRTVRYKDGTTKMPVGKDLILSEDIEKTVPVSKVMDEKLTSPPETQSSLIDMAKGDSLVSELESGHCKNKESVQVKTKSGSSSETTEEAEEKCFSQGELTRKFTDKTITPPIKVIGSSCINVTRMESAIIEALLEEKSNAELPEVPLGDVHDQTMLVSNAEASPAQKEQTSTCQPLRGQFKNVKPNLPQTLRTGRSKSEKESHPTSNVEFQVTEPTLPVESEHEHTHPDSGPLSDLQPTPAYFKATNKERKTSPRLIEPVVIVAAPTGQGVTGNTELNEAQLEPGKMQGTIDIISKSRDENQITHASATESSSEHFTTGLARTQVKHGLSADPVQVHEDENHPNLPATSVEVLPVSQARVEVGCPSQLRKSRLQKVKPKPNLSQARSTQSKGGSLKDTLQQTVEEAPNALSKSDFQPKTSTTELEGLSYAGDTIAASSTHEHTEESSLSDEKKKAHRDDSKSMDVQQRIQRFSKAKPTVVPSARSKRTQLQSGDSGNVSDNSHLDTYSRSLSEKHLSRDSIDQEDPELVEKDGKDLNKVDCCFESVLSGQSPDKKLPPVQTDSSVTSDTVEPNLNQRSSLKDNEATSGGLESAPQNSVALMPIVPSTQVASTSSSDQIQSCQEFSDFLPDQVPSDPDEPFFILSLTTIPSHASTETAHSQAGNLLVQPVQTSLVQEQTVSEESWVTGGDASVPNEPLSAEERDSKSETHQTFSFVIADVPQETLTSANRTPKSPENEDCNEAQAPPAKGKQPASKRRAKLQTQPTTAQRKQTSKRTAEGSMSASKRRKTRKDSESAGPSEENSPESHVPRRGAVNQDQASLTSGEDLSGNLVSKTTKTIRSQRQKRQAKDKTTSANSPPPTKAASSKGSKAKAVREKTILPQPAASTSHDLHLTQQCKKTAVTSQTEAGLELKSDRTDPNTSVSTAEVSASQGNVCALESSPEEETISVSQYFFGDIFTEVEEK